MCEAVTGVMESYLAQLCLVHDHEVITVANKLAS
jgi:hypothetical protein